MHASQASGKPLLLLDIDGTLCPVGPGPGGRMTRLATGGAGSVSFRADLPELLAELGRRFELAWATAWEDSANLLLAPALRLPALPVVRFRDPAPGEVGDRFAGRTWKLPSVRRFAGRRALACRRRPPSRRLRLGRAAPRADQADHDRSERRPDRLRAARPARLRAQLSGMA